MIVCDPYARDILASEGMVGSHCGSRVGIEDDTSFLFPHINIVLFSAKCSTSGMISLPKLLLTVFLTNINVDTVVLQLRPCEPRHIVVRHLVVISQLLEDWSVRIIEPFEPLCSPAELLMQNIQDNRGLVLKEAIMCLHKLAVDLLIHCLLDNFLVNDRAGNFPILLPLLSLPCSPAHNTHLLPLRPSLDAVLVHVLVNDFEQFHPLIVIAGISVPPAILFSFPDVSFHAADGLLIQMPDGCLHKAADDAGHIAPATDGIPDSTVADCTKVICVEDSVGCSCERLNAVHLPFSTNPIIAEGLLCGGSLGEDESSSDNIDC